MDMPVEIDVEITHKVSDRVYTLVGGFLTTFKKTLESLTTKIDELTTEMKKYLPSK